jgi:hypothetical protein
MKIVTVKFPKCGKSTIQIELTFFPHHIGAAVSPKMIEE